MRITLLLLLAAMLPGCAAPAVPLIAIPAVAEAVSLRAFGRTMGDGLVSLVTGEDCSIARIGRGDAYCGQDAAPAPQPICTRSLGAVDCWTVPPAAWPAHRGVADGPSTLTAAQENDRIGWGGRISRSVDRAFAPDPAPPAELVQVVTPAPVVMLAPAPPEGAPAAARPAEPPRPGRAP